MKTGQGEMIQTVNISNKTIGQGHPTYIIAEMSANHNQSFENAVKIIKAAKKVGADAVKLQTYTPDTLTINCHKQCFNLDRTIWEGKNLYDLYGEAYTPWEWHPELMKVAKNVGLDLFSTPFDATAVDFLEELDVPAYKVASFEILDLPLLRKIASKGKPIIMSTGMTTLEEISEAVQTLRDAGSREYILLKCTSAYPAPVEEMNLRSIPHMAETFGIPAGLSDHTLGTSVAVAAVALGACIVEKHFTLSRKIECPDSAFSMEPEEFRSMVEAIRNVEKALGRISYDITPSQTGLLPFRRSLFVVKDIKEGEVFTEENVRSIRPGNGLKPKYIQNVLGRCAASTVERGTPLAWEHLA